MNTGSSYLNVYGGQNALVFDNLRPACRSVVQLWCLFVPLYIPVSGMNMFDTTVACCMLSQAYVVL